MTIRRTIAAMLVWALATSASAGQAPVLDTPAERAAQWRTLVQALEPAALVRVHLADGHTLKGTIVSSTADAVTLSVRTRIPVPPRQIPYAEVVSVDRARDGMNPGLKVLIGAGTIAASAVLLMAAMFAAAYD